MSPLPTVALVLLPPAGSLNSGHIANSGSGNTSTSTSGAQTIVSWSGDIRKYTYMYMRRYTTHTNRALVALPILLNNGWLMGCDTVRGLQEAVINSTGGCEEQSN